MRDYLRENRLREMDRRQDTERMVAEFGACYFCGMHEDGFIEHEDGDFPCPVCNKEE